MPTTSPPRNGSKASEQKKNGAPPPGILVDHDILKARQQGLLKIDPFSEDSLEPATYDVRVGSRAVISTSSKVINLENARLMVVEPGAMAILQSLELIELSKRVTGRIGPKTSLLRRGVFAATGPQIDPGFSGRLMVNLINLSPRPFALHYADPFLSVEFHMLTSEPTRGYQGPHQSKTELSAEEIEILLSYQGPTLADLYRGFAEIRDNIRDVAALRQALPRLIETQERSIISIQQVQTRLQPTQGIVPGTFVPITTFVPEPYEVLRQIIAVIQPGEEAFSAGFYEANIYASGDTEEEALRNLKSLILDIYDSLSTEPAEALGPQPARQLQILKEFVRKRG